MKSRLPSIRFVSAVTVGVVLVAFISIVCFKGQVGPLDISFDWNALRLLSTEFTQEDGAGNWHSGRYYQIGPVVMMYHRSDYYRRDSQDSTNASVASGQ